MERVTYSNTAGKYRTPVSESSECGDCRYVDPLLDEGLRDIEVSRLENQGKRELDR